MERIIRIERQRRVFKLLHRQGRECTLKVCPIYGVGEHEGAKCGDAFVKFVINWEFCAQPKIREIRAIRCSKKNWRSQKSV